MKSRARGLAAAGILALSACRFGGEQREPKSQPPVGEMERIDLESAALSNLAALKAALTAYSKARSRAPAVLEELAPQYLPAIPYLELGVPGHKPTDKAQTYPALLLSDLKDTGGWGYVPGQAPAVFVDCTHVDSRGKPWYLETGAF